jgi:hypothetical protein
MKVVLSVEQKLEALEKLGSKEIMQMVASDCGMGYVFNIIRII